MKLAIAFVLASTRLTLGVVLVYAGITKIRHPYEYLVAVYGYQMVGPVVGAVVAAGMPWLEVITGVLLIWRMMLPGALVVSSLLGIVICIATTSALARGLEISCGCFGSPAEHITAITIWRAYAFLAGSLAVLLSTFGQNRVSRFSLQTLASLRGVRVKVWRGENLFEREPRAASSGNALHDPGAGGAAGRMGHDPVLA